MAMAEVKSLSEGENFSEARKITQEERESSETEYVYVIIKNPVKTEETPGIVPKIYLKRVIRERSIEKEDQPETKKKIKTNVMKSSSDKVLENKKSIKEDTSKDKKDFETLKKPLKETKAQRKRRKSLQVQEDLETYGAVTSVWTGEDLVGPPTSFTSSYHKKIVPMSFTRSSQHFGVFSEKAFFRKQLKTGDRDVPIPLPPPPATYRENSKTVMGYNVMIKKAKGFRYAPICVPPPKSEHPEALPFEGNIPSTYPEEMQNHLKKLQEAHIDLTRRSIENNWQESWLQARQKYLNSLKKKEVDTDNKENQLLK